MNHGKKGVHFPETAPFAEESFPKDVPSDKQRLKPVPRQGHGGSVDTTPHHRRGPYLKEAPEPSVFEKPKKL